jgi:nitroreductase
MDIAEVDTRFAGQMDLLQAIRERRAVRDYKPDTVPQDAIHKLISAACWAPSAMNAQPCHFTVVTDKAVLDDISRKAKAWLLKSVYTFPRPVHFRDLLSDKDFHLLYHAPALIIISAPALGQWSTEDCTLAAQNLMLAATSLGLGSCWIGFAQGWLNSQEARELLNLPPQNLCVAPIAIGHPKAVLPPTPRKAPAVNWVGQRAANEDSSTQRKRGRS